jgi:hypothetical protein
LFDLSLFRFLPLPLLTFFFVNLFRCSVFFLHFVVIYFLFYFLLFSLKCLYVTTSFPSVEYVV